MGELFVAAFDLLLSTSDVVEPDLLFVSTESRARLTETSLMRPPDLVIEVISDSTRKTDEIKKRRLHERTGVPEYWLVEGELETVRVYRRGNDAYARVVELSGEAGDTLTTRILPGFALTLATLCA